MKRRRSSVPGALFSTGKARGGAKRRVASTLERRTGPRCEIVGLLQVFHFGRIVARSSLFVNGAFL
jgi:hypothetical protein